MNDNKIVGRLNKCLQDLHNQNIRIMEVCGTHTRAISKSGIRYLLPKEVLLLSGPGCPVCVTYESYIDMAIELAKLEEVILVTFGDMLKVKGTRFSLSDKQMQGSKIIVVYSPEDALTFAYKNRDKAIVFLAVGFETTAPLIAVTVKQAVERCLDNILFLTALKCIKPAIRFILQDGRNKIDGMICPGHVAVITGADHFKFITDEFGIPAVVCGFENQDIAAGICLLLEQLTGKRHIEFMNLYKRSVSSTGNKIARNMINDVFDVVDGEWRGLGIIKNSELVLSKKYEYMDASKRFGIKPEKLNSHVNCLCGEILMGLKLPYQCSLFGSVCTPEHPSGPCMVSAEGACSVHFRYGGYGING